MTTLTDLGNASWRLRKWLNNSTEERKMPANSALKTIDRFLSENKVEIIDPIGSKFDVGLAVTVVNNEAEKQNAESLVIIDTIKPIITIDGQVSQYGQVILGEHLQIKGSKKDESQIDAPNSIPPGEDAINDEQKIKPVIKEEQIIRLMGF